MLSQLTRRHFGKSLAQGVMGVPLTRHLFSHAGSTAASAEPGSVTAILRGSVLRSPPRTNPPGGVWRYGLGFPFQLAPRKAAIFSNIKGSRGNDFEEGTDVILSMTWPRFTSRRRCLYPGTIKRRIPAPYPRARLPSWPSIRFGVDSFR